MKIERLNENQLRFTVWSKDLPDEDFTIADLAGQTEKAEELINDDNIAYNYNNINNNE